MIRSLWSMVYGLWSRLALFAIILTLSPITYHLSPCYAETISSKELIENAKALDGKEVTCKGEAVTTVMHRGEYSWVNLNDGDDTIGIWCKTADLKSVRFIGDYKDRGDILEITGTFNRACPTHAGEMDIHAGAVKIVETGRALPEHPSKKKIYLSVILFLILLSLVVIFRKRI